MIQSLNLKSYRGFRDTTIVFSNITCLVGENSTGKSTIIQAIQGLLTSNKPIPQNHCKVGINDKRTTSLSLVFQNGKNLSKNIQGDNRGSGKVPLECITRIEPINTSCSFSLENNSRYDQPIKNQDIRDSAWQSILSQCDFTLRAAAESTTTPSDTYRFNKQYTAGISEKFTNDFNNVLEGSIGRKYEFEVVFENTGNQLVVQLHISYRESGRESDKQSSWVDLNYESDGFRILMALCSYLLNDQDKSEKIFVMDEPFTNIHPRAQRHVSRMLQSLSQRFQIIYATHCPHLVPQPDNTICTLTEAAGDLSVCRFEEYDKKLFYELSPLAVDTIEEIKESDSAINVCVEGKTDAKIYEKFFERAGISDMIDITNVKGVGNMGTFIMALAGISKASLFIVDPGEDRKQIKGYRKDIEKHTNLFLLELSCKENNHVKTGIENLMPNHIIEKAFEKGDKGVEFWTQHIPSEKPIEVYKIVQKEQLAEFFVNEAEDKDYKFFRPVIDRIKEIQSG